MHVKPSCMAGWLGSYLWLGVSCVMSWNQAGVDAAIAGQMWLWARLRAAVPREASGSRVSMCSGGVQGCLGPHAMLQVAAL